MKKFIPIILLLLFYSCAWFNPEYTSGLEGQALPALSLQLPDSSTFTTMSIPAGKSVILFLYQPSCPYCKVEIDELLHNMQYLKDIPIYMITSYSYPMIQTFARQHHLSQYPNIVLLRDSSQQLLDYYNAPGVPYIAIYNGQKRLKKVIVGKQDHETLKRAITNL